MQPAQPRLSRRSFLRSGMLATAAVSPLAPLLLRGAAANPNGIGPVASPYGTPVPTPDLATGLPLLHLPPDFRYTSLSWNGDPMDDGTPVPSSHDGMAVVHTLNNRTRDLVLIRNHEVRTGSTPIGPAAAPTYDPTGPAGCTVLTLRRGQLVDHRVALAGTHTNCAGGPTPWGTWLTCEEITTDGDEPHGFVFEVPGRDPNTGAFLQATANPITAMGRFAHEAAAVDPRSGYVYLTQDRPGASGFYRFRPNVTPGSFGSLEQGGSLEMLSALGAPHLGAPVQGTSFTANWVPITDPLADPYAEGILQGGTTFLRPEGCWWSEVDQVIYWIDTQFPAGNGTLWRYTADGADGSGNGTLTAIFVGDTADEANGIDNLTVSPRGGLIACEDGGNDPQRLIGLTLDGCSYVFGENNVDLSGGTPPGKSAAPISYTGLEFAGACFDPSGRYMFVNALTPGITFAITGPWGRGPL